MSSTNCHRCNRLMASALPLCPHCGASQDAQSRAESNRRNRTTLLAVGVGAALGLGIGSAAVGGTESLLAGAIIGALVGRALVGLRCGW